MKTIHTTLLSEAPGPSSPAHEKPTVTGTGVLARSGRRAAAALLAAVTAFFVLPLQAQAVVLVSNIGQPTNATNSPIGVSLDHVQGFETGDNSSGYTLTSIEVKLVVIGGNTSGTTPSATLHKTNAADAAVAALTGPGTTTGGAVTFTAPANTTLNADSTYFILLQGGTNVNVERTYSDSEDSGGQSDWTVLTSGHHRAASNTNTFLSVAEAKQISVNGPAILSTDATLSDLALKNVADVENGVIATTVEPTSDNNATLAYLDHSNAVRADADLNKTGFQVALAEGANTIKVKVTAEDGNTTDTYIVVVTRAMAVSISADTTSAVFKEDDITYTLTRTGSTAAALPVTVALTQTKDFLAAADLSKTVTIAAGQSTSTFTVSASSFQHFAAGTLVEGGTLSAAVVDGTDYDLGTPASVDVGIVIGMTVRFDMAAYSVGEADGTLSFTMIARTGAGAPQPSANFAQGEFFTDDTNGTASQDTDFDVLGRFLNFPPSATFPRGLLTPYSKLDWADDRSRALQLGARLMQVSGWQWELAGQPQEQHGLPADQGVLDYQQSLTQIMTSIVVPLK